MRETGRDQALDRLDRAAEPVVPLEHADAPALLREQRRAGERVDAAADEDRVEPVHGATLRRNGDAAHGRQTRRSITLTASGLESMRTKRRPSFAADGAERAAAGEEVEAPVARRESTRCTIRRTMPARLLGRVAGLLAPFVGTIVCHQTSVGSLPARRLLRPSRGPGAMYGLAVDVVGVEVVARRVLDVDEDRVVLRRPARFGARAVVVRPDDLVQEAVAAEDLVEQDLAVVRLAVVEVEVERARRRRAAAGPRSRRGSRKRGSRRRRRDRTTPPSSRVR